MTTSVKVKFRTSRVPGKAGSIYYQVTHDRQVRRVATRIRIFPEWWDADAGHVRPLPGEASVLRLRIDGDVALLQRIVRDLMLGGHPYTADEIVARFRMPRRDIAVLAFLRSQITRMTSEGRLGTARNYARTLNSFSDFLGGADLPFAAFTEPLVEEYSAYLMQRGVVRNTVSFYMRNLRAVYNKAVRQHLTEQCFPFSGVYTGIDHTRKRAVDERLIGRLRNLDLSASAALALARDLFIFSYCTRGTAFVDMAFLRKRDLSGGEIHYVRRKTGQLMTVRLETCMREIIRRYEWRTRSTPYVFPLLTAEEPGRAYAQYQVALNYYNRQLKRLSQRLGFEGSLSSYTSRHSWATAARNHRIPITVISAGMGHTSEHTTRIYLSSLESSVIDCANRKILSALNRI